MRLKTYVINEAKKDLTPIEPHEWIDKVKNECGRFLKDLKSGPNNLIRTESFTPKDTQWVFVTRKNIKGRRPKDMHPDFSKKIDNAMKELFGWKPRSDGLFCYIHPKSGELKNIFYSVIPAGDYKYVWSPMVQDLYVDYHYIDLSIIENVTPKQLKDGGYTDKGWNKIKRKMIEISVSAPKFYMISGTYTYTCKTFLNRHPELEDVVKRIKKELPSLV